VYVGSITTKTSHTAINVAKKKAKPYSVAGERTLGVGVLRLCVVGWRASGEGRRGCAYRRRVSSADIVL
jgi:hypothetical protein